MIQHALGHDEEARSQLGQALAINPYFHPTQVAEARATIALLTRPEHVAEATTHSVR